MILDKYDTLMVAVDDLTAKGYTDTFKARKQVVEASGRLTYR